MLPLQILWNHTCMGHCIRIFNILLVLWNIISYATVSLHDNVRHAIHHFVVFSWEHKIGVKGNPRNQRTLNESTVN